jgi:hypothetical protein
MVSIAAFQAVDPGSIPGRRIFYQLRPVPRGITAGISQRPAWEDISIFLDHCQEGRGGRVVKALDC